MEIRKARLGDVEGVISQATKLLKQHAAFDSYFTPSKEVYNVYKKFLTGCVHAKNRHLLVAKDSGKIIGYAIGEIGTRPPGFKIRKLGFISDVYVEEKYRRRGITKQFLIELKKWFKEKKLNYVELTVHVKNDVGMKVWSKYGFKGYIIKKRVAIGDFDIR